MASLSAAEALKNVLAQQAAAADESRLLALVEKMIAFEQKPLLKRIDSLEARIAELEGGVAE